MTDQNEQLIAKARRDAFNEAASIDAKVIAMLMAAGKVSREDVDAALARVAALTTPQPTTQFEAWAKLHHYDLVRCSHEPYAAYRSDLTNAALAGWRGANGEAAQSDHSQCCDTPAYCSSVRRCTACDAGVCSAHRKQPHERAAFSTIREMLAHYGAMDCREGSRAVGHDGPDAGRWEDYLEVPIAALEKMRATAPQSTHYQQLLGVAYVVLGCLVANGVDIPMRFLDAFSDPDSVENPLELLPCDFLPARAVRAAVEAAALTDEQRKLIEDAAECISYAVTWEQDGFDTPPMPATEWDYNADQLAYALRNMLRADKEGT